MWVLISATIACIAVACTHYISPHAIGSGIPEMKVILKGVALKQYLSVQTLVAKIVGLLFALGCVYYTGLRRVSPFLYSGIIRLSLSLSLSQTLSLSLSLSL